MALIRIIVLHSMVINVCIFAKYVESSKNWITDSLSRLQFGRFAKLTQHKHMDKSSTLIPDAIWPVNKIWKEAH